MRFDTRRPVQEKKKYLNSHLHDSIEFMKEVVELTSIHHHRVIRRLATELHKIFVEKKQKNENGDFVSLWTYVFSDLEVPQVLSIENLLAQEGKDLSEVSGVENLNPATFFATSLKISDGAYKPVISLNKKTNVESFLATNILRLPKAEGTGYENFSVQKFISLIRNKETAHVDSTMFESEKNDPFSILEKFDQRYLVVLGLAEFAIAVSEIYSGRSVSYIIEDSKETGHVRIKEYDRDPIGETFPSFVAKNSEGMPCASVSFQLYRELYPGEKFHILSTGGLSIHVNEKGNLALQCFDDPAIELEAGLSISPRRTSSFADLLTTLKVYHNFENHHAILDETQLLNDLDETDDIIIVQLIQLRANAWLKLGNLLESEKLYQRLLKMKPVAEYQAFSSHISNTLEGIQKRLLAMGQKVGTRAK